MINRFLYIDCQNARDLPQPEIKKDSMFRQKMQKNEIGFHDDGTKLKKLRETSHAHIFSLYLFVVPLLLGQTMLCCKKNNGLLLCFLVILFGWLRFLLIFNISA